MKAKVCILIPCTDRSKGLERCLLSAISQEYEGDLDVLLIENNSKDNEIVSSIVNRIDSDLIRHVYLLGSNNNANHARNASTQFSEADYIFFLDSDDYLEPNHVTLTLSYVSEKPSAIYSSYILDNGDRSLIVPSYPIFSTNPYNFLFGSNKGKAQTSTYCIHNSILKDLSWDESLKRNQDYDFFIRVQMKYGWIFKETATTHLFWEKNVRRAHDRDSYDIFIEKHFPYMSDREKASYLYQLLLVYVDFSKPNYKHFQKMFKSINTKVPFHWHFYMLGYEVSSLIHSLRKLLRF